MEASVVEEVKVDVLHEKPFGIPVPERLLRSLQVIRTLIKASARHPEQSWRQRACLLGAVVHVLDHSWRKRLQSQSVVNGDGDPAPHGRLATDDAADLGLEGKVAAFMLCHFHPVHPLQPRDTSSFYTLSAFVSEAVLRPGEPLLTTTA